MGGQPGYGAPGQPMGQPMGSPMGMQMGGMQVRIGGGGFSSKGWKVYMIVIMLVTTVPITVIMLYTFVDFSALTGDGPEGGYCAAAARCCKVVGNGNSACDNFEDGMPVEGCKQALESYKKAAKAMGKSCKE